MIKVEAFQDTELLLIGIVEVNLNSGIKIDQSFIRELEKQLGTGYITEEEEWQEGAVYLLTLGVSWEWEDNPYRGEWWFQLLEWEKL